jgi:Zn-dependent metalloprotease
MVFGNGDNVIFKDLTSDLDVPGHELTHGVTSSARARSSGREGQPLNLA